MSKTSVAWQKKHPEKSRAASKRWREKHPEKSRAKIAKWEKENPDKMKAYRIKANRKRRDALFKPTRPEPIACECCGLQDTRALCLDHCHATGTFRGWLCGRCNKAFGLFGDTVEAIQRALNYITNTTKE